jgi:hypothetical protein
LILAELNGKNIGPHGEIGFGTSNSDPPTVTVTEQLPPGHGLSQLVRLVPTFTVIVSVRVSGGVPLLTGGMFRPVVSRVTSEPVVDESCPPPDTDQLKDALSAPVALARSVMRSPSLTESGDGVITQVTVGHGGSVTSKLVVQVVVPVVTHSLGQSTAGTVAVTVVVTV